MRKYNKQHFDRYPFNPSTKNSYPRNYSSSYFNEKPKTKWSKLIFLVSLILVICLFTISNSLYEYFKLNNPKPNKPIKNDNLSFAIKIPTKPAPDVIWPDKNLEQDLNNNQEQSDTSENIASTEQPLNLSQEENNSIEPAENWLQFTIKPGKSLAYYFNKAQISPKILQEILEIKAAHKILSKIHPGQHLKILLDEKDQFNKLILELDKIKSFEISLINNKYQTAQISKPIEKVAVFKSSKINDSLFISGKKIGLENKTIMALADIFAWDIDFALDIRPNDEFKILYEEQYIDGEKINQGSILAAEFVNNNKKYEAIRYKLPSGKYEYFTPKGESLKGAFIRTPVEYTRISSHFNLKRKHPVLHKIRAHKGTDYAAPTGTPVKATANGKVEFAGKKGGYGNAIILQHGKQYSTLYAHLSGFAKNIKANQKVTQGQIIGYVGSTGLASGPHLHYEFRINEVHHNPLTVPLPKAKGIAANLLDDFKNHQFKIAKLMRQEEELYLTSNGKSMTQTIN